MTSPVERISGPSIGSTPGNLAKGNIAAFTLKYGGSISRLTPCCFSVCPTMQRAAILASGWPIAFETYGIVRDARRIARMDARLFDVLHHAANPYLLAIADAIDIAFNRII